MLFALHCPLAVLYIERRSPLARVIQATLDMDIHHAVFSMILAVHCRLAALDNEARHRRAGHI